MYCKDMSTNPSDLSSYQSEAARTAKKLEFDAVLYEGTNAQGAAKQAYAVAKDHVAALASFRDASDTSSLVQSLASNKEKIQAIATVVNFNVSVKTGFSFQESKIRSSADQVFERLQRNVSQVEAHIDRAQRELAVATVEQKPSLSGPDAPGQAELAGIDSPQPGFGSF